jgi:hypothetical protein
MNSAIGNEILNYEVFKPNNYEYKSNSNNLLFLIDFSNSMGEYLEHKTKTSQVKSCMKNKKATNRS